MNVIRVWWEEWATPPSKGHFDDAGVDLRADDKYVVRRGGSRAIDTGVHLCLPHGYYGKIESKSGLNVLHDVVSLGGTIDAGYTGTIVVKLYNFGDEDYTINAGDKIAQLIVMPCCDVDNVRIEFQEERGVNGFGSTGK